MFLSTLAVMSVLALVSDQVQANALGYRILVAGGR